tara:strand:+ start:344 stop:1261 length:918 start_codon:yes stop_codon:yes gene_type:complete
MDKYSVKELLEAYKKDQNIIQLLKKGNSDEFNIANKMSYIEIAYDLQSGSYIEAMNIPEHEGMKRKKCKEYAQIISNYIDKPKSLLKGGVGEAVTLVPILDSLNYKIKNIHGFDISWSRVFHAKSFLKDKGYNDFTLCTGVLQSIPYIDNSFDLVITSHSLEPNGGYEKVILQELMRVSSNIVALFEPSYEFASKEGKKRMTKHGYVKNLPSIAESLGFRILSCQKLTTSMNQKNPTAALILQVPNPRESIDKPKFACPITKNELSPYSTGFFSKESFRFYPQIDGIPNLRKKNGVLASSIMKSI